MVMLQADETLPEFPAEVEVADDVVVGAARARRGRKRLPVGGNGAA
jgi:hypothetical protein